MKTKYQNAKEAGGIEVTCPCDLPFGASVRTTTCKRSIGPPASMGWSGLVRDRPEDWTTVREVGR